MSTYRVEGPSGFGLKGRIHAPLSIVPESAPPRPHRRVWPLLLASALLALGVYQLASASWIHAKAFIAQKLIAYSWERTRDSGLARRPWPSADTRAIARLTVPARDVDLYVLEDRKSVV